VDTRSASSPVRRVGGFGWPACGTGAGCREHVPRGDGRGVHGRSLRSRRRCSRASRSRKYFADALRRVTSLTDVKQPGEGILIVSVGHLSEPTAHYIVYPDGETSVYEEA